MRSLVVLCVMVATAVAQPKNEDKAEADRLFEEARALLAENKREEACAKFEISFRKDPRAVGTMLNLGLCGEMSGNVATAVRYYEEARDRGRDQQLPEYVAAAERKIALLSPRVPRITVTLAEQLPGTRVLVDATVLSADQLVGLAVDPGQRTIVVTAPERLPYETTLELAEGAQQTVAIPKLEGQKTRTVTLVVKPSKQRTWGKIGVVAGSGILLGAVGLGYYAQHAYWSQFPDGARDGKVVMPAVGRNCWTAEVGTSVVRQCNALGADKLASARRLGWVATGVGITGVLVAATGAYLWLSAPSDRAVASTQLGIAAGPELTGVTLGGSF